MSGKLILKELKAGFNALNKYPVNLKTKPVSKVTKTKDEAGIASIGDLHELNSFCKPNKLLKNQTKSKYLTLEARSKLRGTSSIAQVYQNSFRIFSAQSKVYHCDFFRLLYFPPDHFLSVFRKSKPAVNVRIVGEVFLNGNVTGTDGQRVANTDAFVKGSRMDGYGRSQDMSNLKRLQSLFASDGSNVPRNYAYLRRSLRTFLGKCFIEQWIKLGGPEAVNQQIAQSNSTCSTKGSNLLDAQGRSRAGVAKDGFYLFQVLVFPDKKTRHEFESYIRRSVQTVADLDWDTFLRGKSAKGKTWVQESNDRVRVPTMNGFLAKDQVPRTLKRK